MPIERESAGREARAGRPKRVKRRGARARMCRATGTTPRKRGGCRGGRAARPSERPAWRTHDGPDDRTVLPQRASVLAQLLASRGQSRAEQVSGGEPDSFSRLRATRAGRMSGSRRRRRKIDRHLGALLGCQGDVKPGGRWARTWIQDYVPSGRCPVLSHSGSGLHTPWKRIFPGNSS